MKNNSKSATKIARRAFLENVNWREKKRNERGWEKRETVVQCAFSHY